MTRVGVLGAGAWGTVLADLLVRQGCDVTLWAYEDEVARSITDRRENTLYLPGSTLAPGLRATTDIHAAIRDCTVICSAVPSHVTRQTFATIAAGVARGTTLICASKGIETDTLSFMAQVAADEVEQADYVALSGPSFAEEVHQQLPTAIVAASLVPAAAHATQRLMSSATFRVYTSDDVVGVSLGGSLKNTIAIAAGILEGLHLGNNPRAALLTRGLAEVARLGAALGARADTFSGLAGMGDLILTCTGDLSRNRQLGEALARGVTLTEYRATHRSVAEGVNTAQAATALARRHGIDMPIAEQVAAVLFHGVAPRDAVRTLMERTLKAERWA
jgi:glycerol-3-phosphate dehydrogenase (NAD(P)+)